MKKTKEWQCLASEPGPDLKLFRVRFDQMKNPRSQAVERMIILEADDSANVVALTPEEEILFVRQYRFGIGEETVELPGGIIDADAARFRLKCQQPYSQANIPANRLSYFINYFQGEPAPVLE